MNGERMIEEPGYWYYRYGTYIGEDGQKSAIRFSTWSSALFCVVVVRVLFTVLNCSALLENAKTRINTVRFVENTEFDRVFDRFRCAWD